MTTVRSSQASPLEALSMLLPDDHRSQVMSPNLSHIRPITYYGMHMKSILLQNPLESERAQPVSSLKPSFLESLYVFHTTE